MARTLQVYPKAFIEGSLWTYTVKVADTVTGVQSRFTHTDPAGVTAESLLRLLKLVFTLVVPDTVTDQDVDDALWLDVASGGPTNGETLWETWKGLAEPKITGLGAGFTLVEFRASWTTQNTSRVRTGARRILVNGRGWTVSSVYQHEGDGSITRE